MSLLFFFYPIIFLSNHSVCTVRAQHIFNREASSKHIDESNCLTLHVFLSCNPLVAHTETNILRSNEIEILEDHAADAAKAVDTDLGGLGSTSTRFGS